MRTSLLAGAALLTLIATPAIALPPVSQAILGSGFENFDESDDSRAYARSSQAPAGRLPRAEIIYDMDNGSMRGVEEFDCAQSRRRLLWAIQYRRSGLRDESARVGEQTEWVAVQEGSLDYGAMRFACGVAAPQGGGK